jgi:hypothetical protein
LRGLSLTDGAELHTEFTVKPRYGRGTASHTDVMLLDGGASHAIEAKWTEPRYDTVATWLSRGGSNKNRRDVVSGWLSLFREHTDRVPEVDEVGLVVYQLLHRAAGACAGCTSSGVAYLQFSPLPSGAQPESSHLKADLLDLQEALHTRPSFQARLITIELEPTAAFQGIRDSPKGSTETSQRVLKALANGPLFRFQSCRVEVVSRN